MKTLRTEIEGSIVEGTIAAGKNGTLWAHFGGETFAVAPEKRRGRKGSKGAAGNPGEIAAPMPGKIIKLLVQKDAATTEGQVLLVMEAMKMEYTLKAPQAGKIKEILCAAGDQVALGQVLLRLDEA